jgi:exosortase/archaeosortase family protein
MAAPVCSRYQWLFSRRWLASRRRLWLLLALLLAFHSLIVGGLTQGPAEVVNLLLVWGGALAVLSDLGPGWRPRPGRLGMWAGAALVLMLLWRTLQFTTLDSTASLLPALAGLGLALLAARPGQPGPLMPAVLILSLMPLMRMLAGVIPTGELSLVTARITQVLLMLCGLPVQVMGNEVRLPGGAVAIGGPCSGNGILAQLLGVALIFALAFPMRHLWQNGVMVLAAPLLGVVANGGRIALLALITSSELPGKRWWFDFFHEQEGSLVFGGIGMILFAWLYGIWMEWQVRQLETP